MKTRIVALILTVVMSLLLLCSCGSYNFAEENLDTFAKFDSAKFEEGLKNIKIEDGSFTTDSATRDILVLAKIYNAVADKIIASTDEEERLTTGKLTAGDVLYFVYKAVDENGNVFFGSNMDKGSITASSSKANHVLKLDDYLEDKGDELLKLIKENLEDVELDDYIYSTLTKTELEADAEEALKAEKPDATKEEIDAAKKEAIKVKEGDTIYISYTRTHKDAETGNTVTEKAAYEMITLDPLNAFHAYFLAESATANVGGTLTTANAIKVKEGETEYTYSTVKILWKVESEGKAIATFEHTPYDEETEIAPSSIYSATGTVTNKIDLNGKALTYYVYPVYAIDAPAFEEIDAADILYYINGSTLKEASYEAFKTEGYVNGSEKLADLLADVADIYDTKKTDNKFYKDGTDLKKALDAYNKVGGANPTTEQKTANAEAKAALADAQLAQLKIVTEKIAGCKSGNKNLSDEIFNEYKENTFHTLKEAYDAEIVENVRKEVLELIYDCVTIDESKYPEELISEFVDHLYESYEYEYYTGKVDSTTTNVETYENFEIYLDKTLKRKDGETVEDALVKEAKEALEPIVKIFVVSKNLAGEAEKVMTSYIQADEKGGAYKIDVQAYIDYYGEDADAQIKKAEKNAKKSYESDLEGAAMFIVDDDYMRMYKKNVGSAMYRNQIETYGEINLRTALQVNNLLYYLTCTEIEYNEEEGHAEIAYTSDNTKIDFRTIDYTIIVETEEDTEAAE